MAQERIITSTEREVMLEQCKTQFMKIQPIIKELADVDTYQEPKDMQEKVIVYWQFFELSGLVMDARVVNDYLSPDMPPVIVITTQADHKLTAESNELKALTKMAGRILEHTGFACQREYDNRRHETEVTYIFTPKS